MRQILIISIFIFFSSIIYAQTTVTPGEILNFQNGTAQARENDIYIETTNNQYYIGLANGKVKFLQDTVRINSTLTGDGSVGSPIGIAQQSAASGQVLSWNGSAWVPTNAAPATTSVSNTVTAPNSLQTTVNGVTGASVNMVTAVSNTSSANNLSTTVNGVTGTAAPIINTNTVSSASGNITSTVNGVSSGAIALAGITTSNLSPSAGIVNAQLANSSVTVNGTSIALGGSGTVTAAPSGTAGGDLTGTYPNPTIGTGKVTSTSILDGTVANADMANMTALSVKGNGTNAAAVPSDIAAGTDGHVLRRSGTTLGFGQVASTGIANNAITYAKIQNVTASRLLGNPTVSAAVPSEISLGSGLSFSGSILNTVNNGTVTNVTGTSPISVATGTTTPVISITRNNIVTGTSSNVATNPLVLDAGATNAVVGGANATLTVNNTAPLWNANQLQGRNIASTVPTTGQLLSWNGTDWAPVSTTVSNTVTAPNSLQTTVNGITGTAVNMVTAVSNTSSANNLSTTVNGVTGTAAPIINTNTVSSASGNITSTVNGISSGAIALAGITTSNLSPSAGIVNTQLANSSVTVNGTSIALGGSGTITAAPSGTAGGDLTGTYPNPTIGTGKVTSTNIFDGTVANADMANMTALSVKGNATNAAAVPTDIAAGTDGHVLRRSGTALGFGQVATTGIADNAVTYAKIQNVAASRLLGNPTGSSAVPSEISLGTGLSFSGSVLNVTLPEILVDVNRTSNYTPAAAFATIAYNTAVTNVGTSYNTTTGIFTASATGFYQVIVSNMYSANSGANHGIRVRIVANGSTNLESAVAMTPYGNPLPVYNSINMSSYVSLSANQTLRIDMGGEIGTISPEVGTGQHNLKIIRLR